MSFMRRCLALGLASVTSPSVLTFSPAAHAATDPLHDDLSTAAAAASCWEIKQNNPRFQNGTYWLQTSTMDVPGQFLCDQTTDGDGWVLIGRGREGWETWSQEQGDQEKLKTRPRTASDFEAVQVSYQTANGLLGGTSISDLEDGLMIQRALNHKGTVYQIVRMRFPRTCGFIWPFKSAYPVDVEPDHEQQAQGGIAWAGFGTSTSWGYVNLIASMQNKYTPGWGYSPLVISWYDMSSSTSYSHRNGSIINPCAEAYVHPQLCSMDISLRAVGDGGIPARKQKATASEFVSPMSWDAAGNLNGSVQEGNIQVQVFEQIGSTMYMGGNFTDVKKGKNGQEIASNGLTGFDATMGEWNGQTFSFNNQVKDLAELPNGKFLVAGDFTEVNGGTHVGAIPIDPATGQIDSSRTPQVRTGTNGGCVSVKPIKIINDYIYLGGIFTHFQGNGASWTYARNGACFDINGKPDCSWNLEFNDSVIDISVDENEAYYYAAGYLTRAHETR